jgi:hypothetical protein
MSICPSGGGTVADETIIDHGRGRDRHADPGPAGGFPDAADVSVVLICCVRVSTKLAPQLVINTE